MRMKESFEVYLLVLGSIEGGKEEDGEDVVYIA